MKIMLPPMNPIAPYQAAKAAAMQPPDRHPPLRQLYLPNRRD
jgi:hypothetical protein